MTAFTPAKVFTLALLMGATLITATAPAHATYPSVEYNRYQAISTGMDDTKPSGTHQQFGVMKHPT